MPTDLYRLLGVKRDASPQQIRAAYAHWAKNLQPEPDAAASLQVRELEDAYSVLGHPLRRQVYDSRVATQQHPAEPMRELEPFTLQEVSLEKSFDDYHPSFEEIFERLWSNFERVSRPKAELLRSLTIELPLSPTQAARGGKASVLVPTRAPCPACLGHGALGGYQCWHCEGHGSITAEYPIQVKCPAGIINEHSVQVPLQEFGIVNFYLTVRFRVIKPEQ